MQDKSTICEQCLRPSLAPSNRLVQDTCGHQKCRACLLDDENSCKQCLSYNSYHKVQEVSFLDLEGTPNGNERSDSVSYCNGGAKLNNNGNDHIKAELFPPTDIEKKIENNYIEQVDQNIPAKEKTKIKEKKETKKNLLVIPPHITVQSNPVNYHCTICQKSFITKSHVKYHQYCTGEVKPFKCEICGLEYILKIQLDVHMCKHKNVKPFKCLVCPKAFRERSKLSRHSLLHSPWKNFVCPKCAKSFKTKECLKIHSFIHQEEKPFSCSQCQAKFSNSSNLKKHLASHSNVKEHMCDECGRTFKLKWALSVHRRSHLNVRPHECHVCMKSFVNLKDLQRHSLIHTDTKQFSCGICMMSFRRKDNLLRHQKNSHPGKKADIIENPLGSSVSDEPIQRSVVVDNPNAVNVITALTTNYSGGAVGESAMQQRQQTKATVSSAHSRPTGSVINGPVKLAFKTPAFKSVYNITRGGDFLPQPNGQTNVSLAPDTVSSSTTIDTDARENAMQTSATPNYSFETSADTVPSPANSTSQQCLSSYSSALHYETSFQNKKHAMIKNIKFKVPPEYTKLFKKPLGTDGETANELNSDSCESGASDSKSVIVTNKR
ncbi:zinc finger protein 624-like [Anthonomus grandis grandis]|uniref:zinc finger protein 624-like n=1 Tax=Anthonomus grandis grandis TaxID=2921223 RepID=UPI002165CC90|nr:zinc finger protein 624-like [Anthonomus grandis grandis]